jgi:hypothetical protein
VSRDSPHEQGSAHGELLRRRVVAWRNDLGEQQIRSSRVAPSSGAYRGTGRCRGAPLATEPRRTAPTRGERTGPFWVAGRQPGLACRSTEDSSHAVPSPRPLNRFNRDRYDVRRHGPEQPNRAAVGARRERVALPARAQARASELALVSESVRETRSAPTVDRLPASLLSLSGVPVG